MVLNKRQREQLRALCDELRDDDGVDPREFFKPQRNRNQGHRKTKQLCRQVQRTLDLVLSGETGDDLLRGLKIVSITPGADASRLLVTVAAEGVNDPADLLEIETRLAANQSRLRSEVAASITRRKTPVLVFQVLRADAGLPGGEEDAQ
ncbi:hypothetical protein [Planctomicrobium piriforme]|uniref:Ribosome-binding factor A n=1 Tax=Planctomicrobium piriforme TaxID=1576369 RepID=A0A1I3IM82_9PLAN|nr:hypothetical protein [Planctomicrobium piriforme]SFI49084.1 hypothetical protein SAMN05421753_109184 [Planctomicrobium piriforme]